MSNMNIVKNMSFLKVSGKMDCTIEFSVFFTYCSTGQKYVSTVFFFVTLESVKTKRTWYYEVSKQTYMSITICLKCFVNDFEMLFDEFELLCVMFLKGCLMNLE